MKYSGHRKLLCELSKLSKLNAFILLGYKTNTDASIPFYKFRPERTGFNMYAKYTQLQLTFLALHSWLPQSLIILIPISLQINVNHKYFSCKFCQIKQSKFKVITPSDCKDIGIIKF